MKRLNLNIDKEWHALLKGVCALKGVTVSEFVFQLIKDGFIKLINEDEQVRSLFLSGDYREGRDPYLVKQSLIEELKRSNDSSA